MNTVRRLLLAMALASSPVHATTVTVKPAGQIYPGDFVTIRIDPGVGEHFKLGDKCPISNLHDSVVEVSSSVRALRGNRIGSVGVLIVTGTAMAEGDLSIGPCDLKLASGRSTQLSQQVLHVGPDIADGTRPEQSLLALKRAGRRALVVTTSIRRNRTFEGEEVIVEYRAVGDLSFIQSIAPEIPLIEGVTRDIDEDPNLGIQPATIGEMTVDTHLLHVLHLYPPRAGSYHVPAVPFFWHHSGTNPHIRRVAPAIHFEVLALPEGATRPAGSFKLDCKFDKADTYWPRVNVRVEGTGLINPGQEPRLERPPAQTVIISPRDYPASPRAWAWYEVHSDRGDLPDFVFDYYDTHLEKVVTLRCNAGIFPPQELAVRRRKFSPPHTSLPIGPQQSSSRGSLLRIGGVAFFFCALLLFFNTARKS